MSELYIGLMSGTSIDGVDGVVVDFSGLRDGRELPLEVLAHAHRPFDVPLASELLALNSAGPDELRRAALAANGLVRVYAGVVEDLLSAANIARSDVAAIGAHGQTVRHRPQEFDGTGYTLQLIQGALLAEWTGIDVACDFRSRDVAAGGQGAPLAPAFHRMLYASDRLRRGVLNIGGISNLTVLHPGGPTLGFDCGPGNALMDGWALRHLGTPYDDRGAWAAGGTVDAGLLASLCSEPFLALPPPKSTGRDLFNAAWLQRHLDAAQGVSAQDVQATLLEFTAQTCARAVAEHGARCDEVLVCGGGAYNDALMHRLGTLLAPAAVLSTARRGLPPTQVEACAFAWLARACCLREALPLESITGARGPRVLGAIYPR